MNGRSNSGSLFKIVGCAHWDDLQVPVLCRLADRVSISSASKNATLYEQRVSTDFIGLAVCFQAIADIKQERRPP